MRWIYVEIEKITTKDVAISSSNGMNTQKTAVFSKKNIEFLEAPLRFP